MVQGRIVHVGIHRTASTWLQSRFFPQVGGPLNDFRAPWDDPIIRPLVRGGQLPEDLPGDFIISSEDLSGHPRSGWYNADEIADRIQKWIPEAKIIVGCRDVDTWLPSLYGVLVRLGETRTLGDLLTPEWERPHLDISAVSREALERRYRSRFSEVLFLPYELLRDDSQSYVKRLSEFIGVDPPELDMRPVGASTGVDLDRARRLNAFRRSPYNRSPVVDLTRPMGFLRRGRQTIRSRLTRG